MMDARSIYIYGQNRTGLSAGPAEDALIFYWRGLAPLIHIPAFSRADVKTGLTSQGIALDQVFLDELDLRGGDTDERHERRLFDQQLLNRPQMRGASVA